MGTLDDFNQIGQKLTGYDANTGQVGPQGPAKDILRTINGGVQAGTPGPTQESIDASNADLAQQQQQTQLRNQQLDIAKNMESSGYQNDIYNQFRNNRFKDLLTEQKQSNQNLSRHGLLYGGIAQGKENQNRSNASYDLSQGKAAITTSAEQQAQSIRNDVLNQGLQQRQTQQQMSDVIFNSAMKDYQNRRDSLKSLGAGLGAVIGTAYGGTAGGTGGAYAGGEVFS